jgi:asparagine synthase (glutamine-hydrolysing)
MVRIAGLIGASARDAALAPGMLQAMVPPGSASRVRADAAHAFGWCGADDTAFASLGRKSAVFDGSLYNRTELAAAGESPAATLLRLTEAYGFESALVRINGDFAAAVYDADAGVLWLGRDRLGVKPMYYARLHDGFAFASRPGALLALPGVSRRADRRFAALFAGSHYRTFDNDPHGSPYADIRQLPAAHALSMNITGKEELHRYWALAPAADFTDDEHALAELYRDLLRDAVSARLDAAGAPAFTLSGGMDSSSVLACAVEALGARQHAYSSVYSDRTFDESEEIKSMLAGSVERWHPVAIGTPDVFALVERMVRAHDEPVATATWLSHYLICEQAATDGFKSLFGGLGGDELNAGEYEYFFFHFADLRNAGQTGVLEREVAGWARHHDHPIYRKNMAVAQEAMARMAPLERPGICLPDRRRLERYAAALAPGLFDLHAYAPEMDYPFASYLKNRTFQDLFRETAPCCLRAEDRQSAAFGLEHFDPFLDYRLLEFMFRVPGTLKIRDGVTKILLREAMRGILPEETRTRIKKTGWNAPAHIWFSGGNLAALRDLVGSRAFRERGIYDAGEVERLLDEHVRIVDSGEPRENHMMFLWQLVNLETWLRSYGLSL